MGSKCIFWHGIRVLGTLKTCRPVPKPQAPTGKFGTSRLMGKLATRTRGFLWDIPVSTHIDPASALAREDCLAGGRQLAHNLKVLQFFRLLLSQSQRFGDLSWCEDDDEVIEPDSVTNPGSYPGPLVVSYTTGGFTPVVGCYVLGRDRTTGVGYVREVSAVGTGTFTLDGFPVEVDTDWEFVHVRYYFPDTICEQPAGSEAVESQADDAAAFDFALMFRSQAEGAIMADAYIVDLG